MLRTENARISAILLTHWHHDHIGGCGDVLRGTAVAGTADCPIWKFPRTEAPDAYPEAIPAGVPLHALADRQIFQLDDGRTTVRIMHTPGHTTDHVCVQLDEERALFSGDCILGEGSAVFEDLYEYMRSLRAIADAGPAVIYPAHGNVIAEPAEKVKWYIEHREKRERQLYEAMAAAEPARGWTAMGLVRRVYGAEVPEHLWPMAAVNVVQCLQKMVREGRIEELTNEEEGRQDGDEEEVVEKGEKMWRIVATAAATPNPRL